MALQARQICVVQNKCKSLQLGGNSQPRLWQSARADVCTRIFYFFPFFSPFFQQRWLMKYQSVLFAFMKHHNIKDFPLSPTRTKNPRVFFPFFFLFFLPVQPCLSSISALLKRQKPLMIQDTRWRGCCQQNVERKEKKETFWVMIDIPASFYYSCDVRPDAVMPETVASHFGWCSNLVICVSLCLPTTWLEEA